MARRPLLPPSAPPPPSTPAEPAGPAFAPPVGTGIGHPPPESVLLERRAFVDGLVKAGASYEQIRSLASKPPQLGPDGTRVGGGLGLSAQQVNNLLSDLRALLQAEASAEEATRRLAQAARCRNDLMRMRTSPKPPWSSIGQHEKLLAEIEGNLAPRRVALEVATLPDALAQVLHGMTEAEVESIIAEERDFAKKLASIPTTSEPVSP